MIITREERLQDPYKEQLHERLRRVIAHIHDRCNNPNFKQYSNYGGRGVTYDPKWESTEGFILDVDSIPGWDEEAFIARKLQLDKDYRIQGNKIYTKNACTWVSAKENMQIQPSRQKEFYAYNVYTEVLEEHFSETLFAQDKGLERTVIGAVLHGKKHMAGDWVFWYKTETPPVRTYIQASNGSEILEDINGQRLSKKLGRYKTAVSSALNDARKNNKQAKVSGWIITVHPLDLKSIVDRYEINRSRD